MFSVITPLFPYSLLTAAQNPRRCNMLRTDFYLTLTLQRLTQHIGKDLLRVSVYKAFIAFFKIKAHIHMNETTLNSQKAKHSERRVGSH